MATIEKFKARDLIGKRLRIRVLAPPCRIVMPDHVILAETTEGKVLRFFEMPGGLVGVIERDDGAKVAFDCGLDPQNGRIAFEEVDDLGGNPREATREE